MQQSGEGQGQNRKAPEWKDEGQNMCLFLQTQFLTSREREKKGPDLIMKNDEKAARKRLFKAWQSVQGGAG
ncbi:hypothetical protein CPA57_05105 [Bombella sp. TMW2.1880]|uniref:Uncharacterized protein n=1 Tax=Bombella favorum TaxID=2039164 RepID=A0ABR5ZN32_9PROT|nr:hypothetical protein [Bombella favorum]